jgi:cyclic beta-1,2-glucan synthetase
VVAASDGGQGGEQGEISCETDRSRFVGRGGTLANPAAMQSLSPLSNTVGSVLDPIISLRRTVTLPPDETAIVDLVLGVTESREAALAHVEKYQSSRMADRAFDLAWTHSQVTLRQLNATEAEAQLYGRLAGALIYADPARRANPGVLLNNRRGQSGLWSYGISGDAPIVLLRISDTEKIEIVRQLDPGALLLAHEGADGGSGHLERGRFGLPPVLARPDHQPDFVRH